MIIYLAAVENSDVRPALASGDIRHGFSSYFWLRKRQPDSAANIRVHVKRHVVDSGAHTFFAGSHVNSGSAQLSAGSPVRNIVSKQEDPDAYFNGYLTWLVEQEPHYDHFVELDVGELVGQDKVREWRKRIVKAGLAPKCIIAYHPALQSIGSFMEEAKKWPSHYVGLQGLRRGVHYDMLAAVRACYEGGVAAHGFAMVKQKYLKVIPYYSVDSTSFKASVIYGCALVAEGGAIHYMRGRPTQSADVRNRIARLSISSGIPLDFAQQVRNSFSKDGGVALGEVMATSARAIQQVEDHYSRLWAARGIRWDERLADARRLERAGSKKKAVASPSSRKSPSRT